MSLVVQLVPNDGAALTIQAADDSGAIRIDSTGGGDGRVRWGDLLMEVATAEGMDIDGAVTGARRRPPLEMSLPIQVDSQVPATYRAAKISVDRVVAEIQESGGFIRVQLNLGDGLEEQREAEIIRCDLASPESPWLELNAGNAVCTLSILRQPEWLAPEEQVGQALASTASVIEVPVTTRGNLRGPGRIVFKDNASQRRRFAELGGEWREHGHGGAIQYLATAFELAEATLTADPASIGGQVLELTPIILTWRPLGYLRDLPHRGSFRVRARAEWNADSAARVRLRLAYREGGGRWETLEPVELRDSSPEAYFEADLGTIQRFNDAETMDVRVDAYGSAVDAGTPGFFFNGLTIMPSELYSVGRGVEIVGPAIGLFAIDAFNQAAGALTGKAADFGGTWAGAGDATDFTVETTGKTARRTEVSDAPNTGRFAVLGAGTETAQTVQVDVKRTGVSAAKQGILLRYVDASNYLLVVREYGIDLIVFRIYKRVAGTVTQLASKAAPQSSSYRLIVASVDASGNVSAWEGPQGMTLGEPTLTASDSALASAGALNDGKYGIYDENTSATATTRSYDNFIAQAASSIEQIEIVRQDGIGEMNHRDSFATAADGSAPQQFTPQGSRIWLPPGSGRIAAKLRRSDSDAEADEGSGDSTDVTVYQRPAFSSLSDTLA